MALGGSQIGGAAGRYGKATINPGGEIPGLKGTAVDLEHGWRDISGQNAQERAKKSKGELGASQDEQYRTGTERAQGVYDQTTPYYKQVEQDQTRLKGEASEQSKNAGKIFQNLQTQQTDLMNQAMGDAKNAMSLKDFQDMNNPVEKQARDFFEQRAQGENKRGLADVGVLSALGAQAMAGQMGAGGPMTGSQLQLMQSQNQAGAGRAFGDIQRRVQQLRDTGYFEGKERSREAYGAGERAQDRAKGQIGFGADLAAQDVGLQQGLRGEQSGYGIGAAQAGMSPIMQKAATDQALSNQYYGAKQGMSAADIAAQNAQSAGMLGALGTIGGTALGAYAGGPQGAQAGGQAGGQIGAFAPREGVPQDQYAYRRQPYGQQGAYG